MGGNPWEGELNATGYDRCLVGVARAGLVGRIRDSPGWIPNRIQNSPGGTPDPGFRQAGSRIGSRIPTNRIADRSQIVPVGIPDRIQGAARWDPSLNPGFRQRDVLRRTTTYYDVL